MKKNYGFTLVELMIALLISTLLISAVFSIFISTNKAMWLTDALSHNQESGRFTLDYLSRHIRFSGFNQGTGQSPQAVLLPGCGKIFCSENNAADSDELVISFKAPAGYSDCMGNPIPSGDLVITRFWVENNNLRCAVSLDNGKSVYASASLLSDIQSMQILVGAGNTFSDIDDANLTSDQITSIRLALLISSADNTNAQGRPALEHKKRSYALLDEKIGEYTDSKIRHVFSTSIFLVNNL